MQTISGPLLEKKPADGRRERKAPLAADDLASVVDDFAGAADLPPAEWLTRLKLRSPRRNLRCLPWPTRFLKRAVDIVLAVSLAVLLVPVLALVAVLVKLSSGGPVIFRQTRVGLNLRGSERDRRRSKRRRPWDSERRHPGRLDRRWQKHQGRPFTLYKFRTMRADAEKDGARFAVRGDPRVTPIGRFLRRTRLDELPQLWNVLRGEMSFVGPRPERSEFIETLSQDIPGYLNRLGLKPGLTGLAQVLNGYDNHIDGFRRKVALDLLYLENCCIWNDLKIVFRTIGVVLTGKGSL
jgi:lipopolysaccharide/colanic/teichoic acid biosynthesis glycosyltransferase